MSAIAMVVVFYLVNILAMISFSAAVAFMFFAFRADATIHHRFPVGISIFLVLIPALAFLVSLIVAWRCTRGTPSIGTLLPALVCASIACFAAATLLGLAVELTAARVMPDAIPIFVYGTFVGVVGLFLAALVNLGFIVRQTMFLARV